MVGKQFWNLPPHSFFSFLFFNFVMLSYCSQWHPSRIFLFNFLTQKIWKFFFTIFFSWIYTRNKKPKESPLEKKKINKKNCRKIKRGSHHSPSRCFKCPIFCECNQLVAATSHGGGGVGGFDQCCPVVGASGRLLPTFIIWWNLLRKVCGFQLPLSFHVTSGQLLRLVLPIMVNYGTRITRKKCSLVTQHTCCRLGFPFTLLLPPHFWVLGQCRVRPKDQGVPEIWTSSLRRSPGAHISGAP